MRLLNWVVLILLPLALCGCLGGGNFMNIFAPSTGVVYDPNPYPDGYVYSPVRPADLRLGEENRFTADYPSVAVENIAWSFGAGVSPSTSNEYSVLVVPVAPGTFHGTLDYDHHGEHTHIDFDYSVVP